MDELLDFFRANAPILVSALALILTISTAASNRRHQRLSVQPRITTYTGNEFDAANQNFTFYARLVNCGLGPAIIKRFELVQGGVATMVTEPRAITLAIEAALGRSIPNSAVGILRKEHTMAKDDDQEIARVTIDASSSDVPEALRALHIRVTYESVYGEEFTYDSRTHST